MKDKNKSYTETMIPWHLKEARREIDFASKESIKSIFNRNIRSAETHIAIAEQMINGWWFNGGEYGSEDKKDGNNRCRLLPKVHPL